MQLKAMQNLAVSSLPNSELLQANRKAVSLIIYGFGWPLLGGVICA